MDTAQQMDDHSAWSRIFRYLVFTEKHIGKENSQAGAGIRLQHIHDGFPQVCRLCCGKGSKNTMINSII